MLQTGKISIQMGLYVLKKENLKFKICNTDLIVT